MKNLFNFFKKEKKSTYKEISTVQTMERPEPRLIEGLFELSQYGKSKVVEGIYHVHPAGNTFIAPQGAMNPFIQVKLLVEKDVELNDEMVHVLTGLEGNWCLRFLQLDDIA